MYAVIRAGGKQYRVAPGDVIRVERLKAGEPAHDGSNVEFNDVVAVSGAEGQVGRPQGEARVIGRVLGEHRADKILVFHYKRKKQYKKLAGHRQPFTSVRIEEIAFNGQKFEAPALVVKPKKEAKPKPTEPEAQAGKHAVKHEAKHETKKAAAKHETKHAAPKGEAHHKPAAKKSHKPAPKKGKK